MIPDGDLKSKLGLELELGFGLRSGLKWGLEWSPVGTSAVWNPVATTITTALSSISFRPGMALILSSDGPVGLTFSITTRLVIQNYR